MTHAVIRALATVVLASGVAGPSAQVRTADPAKRGVAVSELPRLVPLGSGIYGYEELRSPGFTTVSLIVVGKAGVLIADGQGSVAATQKMLDKIRTVTDLPVRWYVVGSDHGDHTAGNGVLRKDTAFIVHSASRRTAYPSEWVRTIDRALALDVVRFVPGHGFIAVRRSLPTTVCPGA